MDGIKHQKNIYLTFINKILKEKEYLIILCLKDLSLASDDLDALYETGIVSLYYAYKLYHQKALNGENFDFLAYRFIMTVMLEEVKHKRQ